MTTIQQVVRAARDADAAAARLRAEVAAAHAAGETVVGLAGAAGVTRQTIYRWLAMEASATPKAAPVRESLRAALELMASLLPDPGQAEQVRKRAAGEVSVQLVGMRMGRTWLPVDAWREMSDEDHAVMAMAADAENRWHAAHD